MSGSWRQHDLPEIVATLARRPGHNQVRTLVADILRHGFHAADIGISTGRLMIAVLGGLANMECGLIRTRTAEGGAPAKARGQHVRRPPKPTPQQRQEPRPRRAEGVTLKELAKSCNVGTATISRLG